MILFTGLLGLATGLILMYGWTRPHHTEERIRKVCYSCGITYFIQYNKPDNHNCEDYR